MRKTLLATSALIAAGVLSTPALAELKVELSGGAKYEMDFVSDDAGSAGTEVDNHSIRQGNSATQIIFDVKNTADNGLTYGYKFDLRAGTTDGDAGSTDESYMFFSGNWGTVHVGLDDDVVDNMVTGGEDALAGAFGYDGTIGVRGSHIGSAVTAPTLAASTADRAKVAYYSPTFGGFDFGVSYTPHGQKNDGTSNPSADDADNVLSGAVRFKHNFGDVSLNAGVGYINGEESDGDNDFEGLMAGVNVGFAGFTAAVGYGDNFETDIASTTNSTDSGDWWTFGLGYNYGAGNVSIGYMMSETDTAGGKDEFDIFVVGADYTIAEGLVAFGEVQWSESENADGGVNNDDYEAAALVLGTKISF